MMLLNRGVFLDLGSVDNGDLDLRPLSRLLPDWQWHPHTSAEDRAARVADADVVVTNKVVLDRAILRAAPNLKLIAAAATGTNNIDLEAARERGIMVCNSRDYATEAVTQHTLTLILNLLTGQISYRDRVQSGDWTRATHFSLFDRPIRQLSGMNLGIIGHGVLGRSVAKAARCLGMNILVAERKGSKPRSDHHPFEDVVAHADVISIHCPLTEETQGLFDERTMRRMKPTAILINTARGGIVNETDLAKCLRAGVIWGAGVDVLSVEPPPADHPLLATDIPNLIVTPHNAWATRASRQALVVQLAKIIHAFERDQPINRLV